MRFYRYIIGLVLFLSVALISPLKAEAFSDTNQHWARMQIEHLNSREIITGYPDSSYRPEAFVSRQEFVVLLIRAMNQQREAEVLQQGIPYFKDSNTWAKGYVELAHEMNLAQGAEPGVFAPLRQINREEAVSILVNCLGEEDESPATATGFNDDAEISAWASSSIALAIQKGLLHGFPDNTFRPKSNLTRAQVAVMLEALLKCQGRQYQISGTITQLNLPLRKVTVVVDERQESFELAANVTVWSQETQQPLTEIPLPANAYFDLNSDGKLTYILITNPDQKISQVRFNYSRLPDTYYSKQVNSGFQSLTLGEENTELTKSNDRKAAASLLATGEAMGVRALTNTTGATGRGQLVAVIDSGVDPGHPDLQTNGQGYRKIVDFIDLTDEGKVMLSMVKASGGYLTIGDMKVNVNDLPSVGDTYKFGYLSLDFLPGETGLAAKKLLVVLAAGQASGEYDTVYLDTDGDGQVNDETGIKKYGLNQGFASIRGNGDRSLNLVVSEISSKENYIKLGFDGMGHGTEMAGIVAASGQIKGMAPDAQLLVIKIADAQGTASLKKLESALSLAAERGAGAAAVSMGQYSMTAAERESLAQTAALIWKSKGMIICMAAGNSGPGVGSVTDSTGIEHILTVGAYATPEMWASDYGWQVPEPTLWYFSSTGPAADASTAPLLLAPGSAISTYPTWADSPYRQDEGTSIAVPHLAGAVALLLDANMHRLFKDNKAAVYRAILASAKPIEGLQEVEQGYGVVNLPGAWQELQKSLPVGSLAEGSQYSPGAGLSRGLYSRGLSPASVAFHITNAGDTSVNYLLGGFADWIKPEQYSVQVPARSERIVSINYDKLNEPGLYSSFLAADDINSSGLDAALLQTVVIPQDMSKTKKDEQSGHLGAGGLKHYFFSIAPGSDRLSFKLMVRGGQGRVRITVISPEGLRETSSYVGVDEGQNVTSDSLSYANPTAGIWEVVAYSSVSLSSYNLKESEYSLLTTVTGEGKEILLPPDDRYLVSTVVPAFTPGQRTQLTLFFWNRGSKLPANGLVSINGRLYEIQNGMVSLSYVPQQENIYLKLAW